MAETVRELILIGIKAAIEAIPAGYPIERNPDNELEPEALPGLALLDGGQVVVARASGQTDYTGRATLVIYVARGADEGAVLNVVYGDVIAALMADITLGGLTAWIRETEIGEIVVIDEVAPGVKLDQAFIAAPLELEFDFATAEDDPTVKMPFMGA